MQVKVKELASQLKLPVDRLLQLLDDANFEGKTEDSELTGREKVALLKRLQEGRVQHVVKDPDGATIQNPGRSGSPHEVSVKIKTRSTVVPRPIAPVGIGVAEGEVGGDESTAQPEPVATTATVEQLGEDAGTEEKTATSKDDKIAVKSEDAEDETPVATELEDVADREKDELKPDRSGTESAPVEPAPSTPSGKRSKTRKKQPREQLHVVKGREKLRKDREREERVRKRETRPSAHGFQEPVEKIIHDVQIAEVNSVRNLASAMSVKATDLIKCLMETLDLPVTINGSIDRDTAELVVKEMGHNPIVMESPDIETVLMGEAGDERPYHSRSPVVAVMGHVDHGKTTLLDAIRSTKVADGEMGGITQHIGAYIVATKNGDITFLDTPGHAAFTEMRRRGATATDIVILVVAADDGVMPQTLEAIKHAEIAKVPMIVAINKIDKTGADSNRILGDLTNHGVIAESLGGDVQVVHISALKKTGIDDLLEKIQLQAELMEDSLQAPFEGIASGVVVESRLDKGRGPVVTVLVQKGILKPKQLIVAGTIKGKVRSLFDFSGTVVREAKPSMPVEVTGFSEVPEVGEKFVCPPDDKTADRLVNHRKGQQNGNARSEGKNGFFEPQGPETINVIVKSDVSGSAEALANSLENLSNDRYEVKVIYAFAGGINQSDINLAIAADAMIVAFNVSVEATARQLIVTNNIDVISSRIIYEALEGLEKAIYAKIGPNMVESEVAVLEVLEVFKFNRVGTIAGCKVSSGTVRNKLQVRVLRGETMIHDGRIDSLRRFENDVAEVNEGLECGIQIKNYNDIHANDKLQVYQCHEER